jgi:hypothetical protein
MFGKGPDWFIAYIVERVSSGIESLVLEILNDSVTELLVTGADLFMAYIV